MSSSHSQAPAQRIEIWIRPAGSRRQAFYRPVGEQFWHDLPVPKADRALRTGTISVGQIVDAPIVSRETEAPQ